MNPLWFVVILLLIFAIVGVPNIGVWNHGLGYAPSGIGLILVIVLLVLLLR
jgi:hypothetical protein